MSAYSATMVGAWVPLMDYAVKNSVSLSTLRRKIKSNKIRYKTEKGRYLIWDDDAISNSFDSSQVDELEKRLREAQEEIAELKMLVAIYEQKSAELI